MVWHHIKDEPPNWWPETIKDLDLSMHRSTIEFFVNCHIQVSLVKPYYEIHTNILVFKLKDLFENAADLGHFGALHATTSFSDIKNPFLKLITDRLSFEWISDWNTDNEKHKSFGSLKISLQAFNINIFTANATFNEYGPAHSRIILEFLGFKFNVVEGVIICGPLYQRGVFHFYCPRNPFLYLISRPFFYELFKMVFKFFQLIT